MSEKPTERVAVVLEREATGNAWQSHQWRVASVIPDPGGEPRVLVDTPEIFHKIFPGFELTLYRDEAEGYYLNVSGPAPSVFVLWRMDADRGLPLDVTVSSEEAGRWLDGGHSVDRVAMPPEIFAWVGDYVEHNYRPEPKQRIKPRSFKHPKDRV